MNAVQSICEFPVRLGRGLCRAALSLPRFMRLAMESAAIPRDSCWNLPLGFLLLLPCVLTGQVPCWYLRLLLPHLPRTCIPDLSRAPGCPSILPSIPGWKGDLFVPFCLQNAPACLLPAPASRSWCVTHPWRVQSQGLKEGQSQSSSHCRCSHRAPGSC